jgi:hypothetical protein
VNEVLKSLTGNGTNQTKPPYQYPEKRSETNETPTSPESPSEGDSSDQQASENQTYTEGSKVLTLEITDICSGKFEDVFIVSEGMQNCLNKKYPYYILLEKNSTHLQTSFYGVSGFNETYELNDSIQIFFIFAEDVASVSTIIESLEVEGSSDFYLGDYTLHTIWERDANGNLYISKMIVALPLNVKNTVPISNEWKELKLYLNIPNKTYSLGNLWVLVKEK